MGAVLRDKLQVRRRRVLKMARAWRRAALPVLLLMSGCAPGDSPESRPATSRSAAISLADARGRLLELPGPATRILSLVPSVTETLHRMGAASVLVGRTDYDTLPSLDGLPSVGGGLGPNLEVVRTLEPQVVVTFAGESDPRTTQGIEGFGIPVFAVRPDRMEDVPRIVLQLGQLVGRSQDAERLVSEIERDLDGVRGATAGLPPLDAVYLLGGAPPLAAGPGTFISDLMALAGARNVLHDLTELYAPVSPEVLVARHVDVVLVGEGESVDPRLVQDRRVVAIPSWVEIPGPRLGEAAWVVARALRPELARNP